MSTVKQQVAQVLSDPINLPAPFLDYLLQYAAMNPIPTGAVNAPILSSTGLVGATKSSRLVGSTTTGSPTQGTFQKGDLVIAQDGHVWVCTLAGSPGTWVDASVAPIQGATDVTFDGDIHLTTAGNTMEQGSVLTLKSSVSDPTVAPTISTYGVGNIDIDTDTEKAWGCYTWVDGSGHESAPSPLGFTVTGFGHSRGFALNVPTIPTGATGFHIYTLLNDGSLPTASALLRQAATTYVSSETTSPTYWNTYNDTGANPPGSTTFPTATPAKIEAADGSILLSGDGTIPGCTGTQATSKTTTVTLDEDRINGQITMNNASLAGLAGVNFLVTNSAVGSNDVVVANIVGPAGTSGNYTLGVPHVSFGGGGFRLFVTNITGGALTDALAISFYVFKVSTS